MRPRLVSPSLAALAAASLALPAVAQEQQSPMADQQIGKHFNVVAEELPEPYADPGVRNPAVTVERGSSEPTVPDGFTVTLFAEGLAHPRQMLVLEDGGVLLAEQEAGYVTFLKDNDGDGSADTISRFAGGFEQPYGLAQLQSGEHAGHILVADTRGIWRVPYANGEIRATGPEIYAPSSEAEVPESERTAQTPMDHLPVTDEGVFGDANGHSTRSLAIEPGTGRMFVGVGSAGNIAVEPEPRATIQVFEADGSGQRTFASGTRNPIGLAFHPDTGALWAVVQERDGLGNRLVPDYLTRVEEGDFFGWPYAYTGGFPQPDFADRAPEKVEQTKMPDLLFEAHSSSMDFVFYTGGAFPEEYHGDAFVALKGSWNRKDPTGYKVVRVPFENGMPSGGYENFITGFWVSGDDRAEVWGRPADVAMTPDGALLIADDTGGTIWRVAYEEDASAAAEDEAPVEEQGSRAD